MCVILPPTMLLSYPCLCMRISNLDRGHELIYILSHWSPSLRKYKWHPGILLGKMLQWYSVRLRIYSWFMKYCHSKLGVCGRHRQVTLVGANKHFWCRCRGRHRVKYIDKSCEQNRNWYSLAKQANLALFSCLCWYENRVVYDRFRSAAKLSFRSRVTFEKSSTSYRTSSDLTIGSRSSHRIIVSS